MDAGAVVDELVAAVGTGLTATGSGRFFGFVIGGALPGALAADWLVSTWDQNAGLLAVTPGVVALETRRRAVGARAARPASPLVVRLRHRLPDGARHLPRRGAPPRASRAAAGTSSSDGLERRATGARRRRPERHATLDARAAPARARYPQRARRPVDDARADARRRCSRPRSPRTPSADDRLPPGRQREHRAPSTDSRRSSRSPTRTARGCTSTARSVSGPPASPSSRHLVAGVEPRRLVGDRRAQVAQRPLRLRARDRA